VSQKQQQQQKKKFCIVRTAKKDNKRLTCGGPDVGGMAMAEIVIKENKKGAQLNGKHGSSLTVPRHCPHGGRLRVTWRAGKEERLLQPGGQGQGSRIYPDFVHTQFFETIHGLSRRHSPFSADPGSCQSFIFILHGPWFVPLPRSGENTRETLARVTLVLCRCAHILTVL